MKKLVTLILALSLVMSITVCAEETEIENETSEEPAKGSRLNPYSFGEDASLGTVYTYEDEYIDVTLNFTEVIDPDTLTEEFPDKDWGEERKFVVRCEVSTGGGCTDDDVIYLDLYKRILTDDMYERRCDWEMYDDSSADIFKKAYTYMDYDTVFVCSDAESYDLDQKYIKLGVDNSVEDLNGEEYGRYIWIEVPEY